METTTNNKYTLGHDREKKERTDDVIVSGEDSDIDFRGLHLPAAIVKGLMESGFKKPSPIQLEAIPLGLVGYGNEKTCL